MDKIFDTEKYNTQYETEMNYDWNNGKCEVKYFKQYTYKGYLSIKGFTRWKRDIKSSSVNTCMWLRKRYDRLLSDEELNANDFKIYYIKRTD